MDQLEEEIAEETENFEIARKQTTLEMGTIEGKEIGEERSEKYKTLGPCLSSGRFTVVPVQEKTPETFLIVNRKPILKRIGTTSNTKPRTMRHSRTNSTPPTLSFCQQINGTKSIFSGPSASSSADDEGYPPSFKQFSSDST